MKKLTAEDKATTININMVFLWKVALPITLLCFLVNLLRSNGISLTDLFSI